jgi:TPR repeat protein
MYKFTDDRAAKKQGVQQDFVKPAEYFRISANQNHNLGLYNYASYLENGAGIVRDRARAAKYYKKAENAV